MSIVNYRPEYSHQWNSKTYYTQLRLDPLGKDSAEEMLSSLLGDGKDLVLLKQLIIARTEGNPFFIEETVQVLLDQEALVRNGTVKLTRPLAELKIPPTVQAILAARIDRLAADEKDLLQTLAVIGREFRLALVRKLIKKPDDDINRMLGDLQLAEFIYEQPATGDIEYIFKHALTQEVAYNSVLTERRKALHERAAQTIEVLFADRLEDHLVELASHYSRSINFGKAVEYLGRAGIGAARQSAHSEAVGYLTRALELLKQLPDNKDRARQELELQMALSVSMAVAGSIGSPEREAVLTRARQLAEQLEDNLKLMEVLLELAGVRVWRRELELAGELVETVRDMAERAHAPAMLAAVSSAMSRLMFLAGDFEMAREHVERAIQFFGPGRFRDGIIVPILSMLGYPEMALAKSRELLAAARRSSDPDAIARALLTDSATRLDHRDSRLVMAQAEEILSIAVEHEMLVVRAIVPFFRGWAMEATGQGKEGIPEMRRAFSDPILGGWTLAVLVWWAEVCARNGLAEEGLAALAGRTSAGQNETDAEFRRLEGQLLLVRDPGSESQAERCFRDAIDIARRQHARWWELRATVSLARLLVKQGRRDEARAMLAEIYNWFTEGFDTADLKDAKSPLDDLGA